MNTKILEDLGLTKKEVQVYLKLLELGSTPAGPLVKKLAMHRAQVYNLLDLLLDKGIISYVSKANIKHFEAHEPKRLLEFLETKKKQLTEKETKLKKLIPKLESKRNLTEYSQEGTIFQGKRGIKSILEDVLNQKTDFFVFGAEGKFKELFPWYFKHFHDKRAKLKIPLKIIFNEKLREKRRSLPLSQIRFLPKDQINPATTLIYNNTVSIIIWENSPQAFVIKSKKVADSYKNFFKILWNQAKK